MPPVAAHVLVVGLGAGAATRPAPSAPEPSSPLQAMSRNDMAKQDAKRTT
jgi:hypothetical protein